MGWEREELPDKGETPKCAPFPPPALSPFGSLTINHLFTASPEHNDEADGIRGSGPIGHSGAPPLGPDKMITARQTPVRRWMSTPGPRPERPGTSDQVQAGPAGTASIALQPPLKGHRLSWLHLLALPSLWGNSPCWTCCRHCLSSRDLKSHCPALVPGCFGLCQPIFSICLHLSSCCEQACLPWGSSSASLNLSVAAGAAEEPLP